MKTVTPQERISETYRHVAGADNSPSFLIYCLHKIAQKENTSVQALGWQCLQFQRSVNMTGLVVKQGLEVEQDYYGHSLTVTRSLLHSFDKFSLK